MHTLLKPYLTTLTLLLSCTFLTFAQEQIGQDINGLVPAIQSGISVDITSEGTRIAIGESAPGSNFSYGQVRVFEWAEGYWQQVGQVIISPFGNDDFGCSVSLNDSGNKIAVGADSYGTNGSSNGQCRIFELIEGEWIQLGESITGEYGNRIGNAVSLSGDGTRLAIGAKWSHAAAIDGGQVRVYNWTNNEWVQAGQDLNGLVENGLYGESLALSKDGSRLVIGAFRSNEYTGLVDIFEWADNEWVQVGLPITGDAEWEFCGLAVSISDDASRIAVSSSEANEYGIVRIFDWVNNAWEQVGEAINGEHYFDNSGDAISLSTDGTRIAIGARKNDGGGIGSFTGHVRIFDWSNNQWEQFGEDIDGEFAGDYSGSALALSSSGSRVIIGAFSNDEFGDNTGQSRIYEMGKPDLLSNDFCFTIQHNPLPNQFILSGDFTNCNVFILDQNENVVQFLLNFNDEIIINLADLSTGLHFVRVEHQQYPDLSFQKIIKY